MPTPPASVIRYALRIVVLTRKHRQRIGSVGEPSVRRIDLEILTLVVPFPVIVTQGLQSPLASVRIDPAAVEHASYSIDLIHLCKGLRAIDDRIHTRRAKALQPRQRAIEHMHRYVVGKIVVSIDKTSLPSLVVQ